MHSLAVGCSSRKILRTLLAVCFIAAAPTPLFANCALKRFAELPIDMHDRRPTIAVKFNDQDARLVLDSGAFFSMISAATAAEYRLKTSSAPSGLQVIGVGGVAKMDMTTVKDFGLIGLTLHNIDFLVGGTSESGAAGLLGQNLLHNFDVEYDLAHGAVRLYKTEGCGKSVLAYWARPGEAYSMLHIEATDNLHARTLGNATLNGRPIRVVFDTGAYSSVLSLKAAERAGVTPDSPGVVAEGYTYGIGRSAVKTYLARFDSFEIGDTESIKNARLRIGEVGGEDYDMLLGADFFVSHRIFISNHERRGFITFNGGSVFDLTSRPAAAAPAGAEAPGPPPPASDAPLDAATLARRGEGFAARQDFTHALADLSRACELKPDEPEYFYRRALVDLHLNDSASALADLNQVLKLREDFLPAYIPRAEIHLAQKDAAAAVADLSSVDRLAPKQADLRLELGHMYARLNNMPAAIAQLSLWIESHPEDGRLLDALGRRCLIRVLENQELDLAAQDCTTALRRADRHDPRNAALYADRGMVRVRQGNYDKAIDDFNAALKLEPKLASALYGRGVAESHKNKAAAASADIAAARELEPKLPERYQRAGIAP
jgi:tetratricopeptide (TPR) repeat protein